MIRFLVVSFSVFAWAAAGCLLLVALHMPTIAPPIVAGMVVTWVGGWGWLAYEVANS